MIDQNNPHTLAAPCRTKAPAMTTTPATQAHLPVTQSDRDAAGDFMAALRGYKQGLDELAIKEGLNDPHPLVQAFARHRISHSLPGDVGMRENDKPPAHWTPDAMTPRGIEAAEGWDWRRDGPDNDPLNRSWNRLRFAYVYADPHAPDQMATVLRIDLGRILSRLTRALAQIEMKDEQIAALTPSPCPGDGMREALASIVKGVETSEQHFAARLASRNNRLSWHVVNVLQDALASCKGAAAAALTPSALSGDAGEGALRDLREKVAAHFRLYEGQAYGDAFSIVLTEIDRMLPSQQGTEP